jgi:hypothetical protein
MVISNQEVINGKLDAMPATVKTLDYFYYTNEVNLLETYNLQDTYFTVKQDLTIVKTIGRTFDVLQGKIDYIANCYKKSRVSMNTRLQFYANRINGRAAILQGL